MNLAVVNEAVTEMNGVEHQFTEEEKNFVVQFAFRSGSKEDTISLIEALAHSADKAESDEIMVTYRSKYDMKPAWVEQVENLLVALEMYRIEEEKAINHLADILTAYGIDVSAEEIRTTETETLNNSQRESGGAIMAEEIQEAVQIIRVAYDGIEIAMKVGSGGIAAMQKAIDFLKGMLDYEKSLGKTSMRKLILKGGDLQVLQFNTEDMKKVEKMAKKYGILYSVLPDCNRKDGLSEVIFHTEAVPRVNMMIQKLKFGKIATFDDYLKNGDEKSLGKLMDFLKKQQGNEKSHTIEGDRVNTAIDGLIEKVGMFAMEKKAISVDQVKENFSINGEQAESVIKQLETIGVLGSKNEDGTHTVMMDKDAFINRVRGYQDLAERMRAVAASKNANLSDVTISKKLIIEENDHAVKTRVPGTWGEEARYVWLRKENIMEIHGGKTMLTFLDSTKDYKLYDEQNRVVTTQKGTELYTHYDKVESSVRERYEKVQKQQKKTTQKKTVTTKKAR